MKYSGKRKAGILALGIVTCWSAMYFAFKASAWAYHAVAYHG